MTMRGARALRGPGGRARLVPVLLVPALLAACNFGTADDYYVEPAAQDVGLELRTLYAAGLPTMEFVGTLRYFDGGGPYPTASYDVQDGLYQLDASFAATAVNVDDPADVRSLSGRLADVDPATLRRESVTITVDAAGTADTYVLSRSGLPSFEAYKCWDGPGDCVTAIGPAACETVPEVDGNGSIVSYAVTADAPYKNADDPDGSEIDRFAIRTDGLTHYGNFPDQTSALRRAWVEDPVGQTLRFERLDLPSIPAEAELRVIEADGRESNRVECPLP